MLYWFLSSSQRCALLRKGNVHADGSCFSLFVQSYPSPPSHCHMNYSNYGNEPLRNFEGLFDSGSMQHHGAKEGTDPETKAEWQKSSGWGQDHVLFCPPPHPKHTAQTLLKALCLLVPCPNALLQKGHLTILGKGMWEREGDVGLDSRLLHASLPSRLKGCRSNPLSDPVSYPLLVPAWGYHARLSRGSAY